MSKHTSGANRKNISATLRVDVISWLDSTSLLLGVPKSRLLENGVLSLKDKYEKDKNKMEEDEINKGISLMLDSDNDQPRFAESGFSKRIGNELL